ncbi:MAG: lysine exporter LysO family protein, partial [Vibrio sp.]
QSTTYLIYIILLLMGLSISALDNLDANILEIGKYSAVFIVLMALCNFSVLPIVDKLLPMEASSSKQRIPLHHMAMDSCKLLVVVSSGLVIGILQPYSLHWVASVSEGILLLLLFFIGIQLRNSGLTLKQIVVNKRGTLIALVVIISCWVGGVLAALILNLPILQGLAMSSGFGWYSLSGILMGDAYGPIFGGSSFIIELVRELIALLLIPMLIHRRPCTIIGYAGATAMDFTLPLIQTSGGVSCVPIAIVSGFILSLFVPVFMLLFVSLSTL